VVGFHAGEDGGRYLEANGSKLQVDRLLLLVCKMGVRASCQELLDARGDVHVWARRGDWKGRVVKGEGKHAGLWGTCFFRNQGES
jgi:hypothetical protein